MRRTLRNASQDKFAPGWALDQNLIGFGALRISDQQDLPAPVRAQDETGLESGGSAQSCATTGYSPSPSGQQECQIPLSILWVPVLSVYASYPGWGRNVQPIGFASWDMAVLDSLGCTRATILYLLRRLNPLSFQFIESIPEKCTEGKIFSSTMTWFALISCLRS